MASVQTVGPGFKSRPPSCNLDLIWDFIRQKSSRFDYKNICLGFNSESVVKTTPDQVFSSLANVSHSEYFH